MENIPHTWMCFVALCTKKIKNFIFCQTNQGNPCE